MAQLIQIRQRIKTIETIKKITHAMRLISMSTHSRLKEQEKSIKRFQATALEFVQKVQPEVKEPHPILDPAKKENNDLVILIGSQKGLCGNFNYALLQYFLKDQLKGKFSTIVIGKKLSSLVREKTTLQPISSYETLNTRNFVSISSDITAQLISRTIPFSNITVYSNLSKGFFIQKPKVSRIIPFEQEKNTNHTQELIDYYLWDQTADELLNELVTVYLSGQFQYLLFESLLAEYAARFISMDHATRNAKTLFEETRIQYNKLRQAKITKELTELSGSFSA